MVQLSWRQKARNLFPHGTTLDDIRKTGVIDKKREGELRNDNFVYLATFPRGEIAQNIRIYLRDVLGTPCIGAGRNEERIYVRMPS
jgi:hypothetical protein